MVEIGPLLQLAEVVEFPEQHLWTLVTDDGAVVELELDDEQQRVVLATDVCELSPEDVTRHCQTLLHVNLLWRQTGGVRFALAETTVVEMLELPLAMADLPTLATAVTNLCASAQEWRQFLLASPGDAILPVDPLESSAIRV